MSLRNTLPELLVFMCIINKNFLNIFCIDIEIVQLYIMHRCEILLSRNGPYIRGHPVVFSTLNFKHV